MKFHQFQQKHNLSLRAIEHKSDHDMWRLKSRSWIATGTCMCTNHHFKCNYKTRITWLFRNYVFVYSIQIQRRTTNRMVMSY